MSKHISLASYELDPAGSLAMINQLVNPFTTDLKPEDVNIFQVNAANGRGYQATASDFVVEEDTEATSTTGSSAVQVAGND